MIFKNLLNKIKKKKSNRKVLVIGEIFEDIFVESEIIKISQEAPVMVINQKYNIRNKYLRGAGNVLQNLLSANVNTSLISLAENKNINYVNQKSKKKISFIIDRSVQNIKKIRYVSNNKHIIRIDHEKKYNFPKKKDLELINLVKKKMNNTSIIVFSDYDKGFLTNTNIPKIIEFIIKHKDKKIFVDSKRENLEIFKNVHLIKINNLEACNYFKIQDIYKRSNCYKIFNFLEKNNIQKIIITTGKNGAILFYKKSFIYLKNKKRSEVYDVSGAGDTFLSYLVVGCLSELEIKNSIMLANHASFLAITKYGISSINKEEL